VEAPGLTHIELEAFKDCKKLESIYMPLVETIADTNEVSQGAFRNCLALYSVFLPRARSIGGYAFYKCSSLDTIFLPAGKSLGADAFKSCSSLISGSLPQAESIGERVFHGCTSLVNIILGKDPPDLGSQAFTGGRPAYIYVPAAGVEAYKETAKENWTAALKTKIRGLPE
jgi:hypothetical protein